MAYGFALLETALSECAETASAVRGIPSPQAVRSPKLEGWLGVLNETYGLDVDWNPKDTEIVAWRRFRNRYVHELEAGEVPGYKDDPRGGVDISRINDFLTLIEGALSEVDRAMTAL